MSLQKFAEKMVIVETINLLPLYIETQYTLCQIYLPPALKSAFAIQRMYALAAAELLKK